jgi:hypothetical protein
MAQMKESLRYLNSRERNTSQPHGFKSQKACDSGSIAVRTLNISIHKINLVVKENKHRANFPISGAVITVILITKYKKKIFCTGLF